jgi:cyclophilin family peptidyl-prolyl cis-trans isomerase
VSKRTQKQQLERAREHRASERMQARQQRQRIIVIVMVALLVLSLVAAALVGVVGGGDQEDTASEPGTAADTGAAEDPDGSEEGEGATDTDLDAAAAAGPCPAPTDPPEPAGTEYDEAPRVDLAPDAVVPVTLTTSCGDIVLELVAADAPRTVENFVALAEDGFYQGTPFHRVIDGFVIQGGDPTGTGGGGPGYQLEDELEAAEGFEEQQPGVVLYPRGTLAMANSGPDTQGSQFFVVQADPGQPFPPDYTVFGTVTDGMDVVDDIAAGPVDGDLAIDPAVVLEVAVDR